MKNKAKQLKKLFYTDFEVLRIMYEFSGKTAEQIKQELVFKAQDELGVELEDYYQIKRYFSFIDNNWEEIQLSKTSDGSWDALKNSNEYKLVNNKL